MLWIRIRTFTVATLAMGIVSGGASVYVRGSQGPAPKDGQPVSKQPTTTTAQSPQPKTSKEATGGQPAATTLQARLRAQRLATRKARIASEIAKLTRELAEIAVEEYEEVGYPRDLATIEGEIQLAQSDLTRAVDRLERAKKQRFFPETDTVSEELSVQKARFALERAQSRRKVLVEYTKGKTLKELRSEVEKARADELAKQSACAWENLKEIELDDQLRLRAK